MTRFDVDPKLFLKIAQDHKDQEFLAFPEREIALTFGQFADSACGLACRLQDEGIGRGDRIVCILPNSPEFALLYFACIFMGVTIVPINPALHPRDVQFVIHNAGAKLIVYARETRHFLQGPKQPPDKLRHWEMPHLSEPLFKVPWQSRAWEPLEGVISNDILTVVFTSGTTAAPKAVAHTIGNLIGNAVVFNREMDLGPSDRFLHLMPMAYSGGFFNGLISPYLAGSSVVMTSGYNPRMVLDFWKTPAEHDVNAMWITPTILASLLRLDRDPAGRAWCRDHMKKLFIGMGPLYPKIKREFETAYGTPLYESYGLSETLLVAANSPRTQAVEGSVGRPLPGIRLELRDAEGREVPAGQEGEIFIQTPHRMAGYLDYETFRITPPAGDWFASGDIGVLQDGRLGITGRKKDLIIRGGLNISPVALEDVLLRHEAVSQAVVVGVPNELSGEDIVAVCKLKPDLEWSLAKPAIEAYCKNNFTSSSRPSFVLEIKEFPVGVTGKIQKNKVRDWALREISALSPGAPAAPRGKP